MIAIIDYGAGNLRSVKNALDYFQVDSKITDKAADILKADRLILPGDGSFGFMMGSLFKKNLIAPIKGSIASRKPFLGICLGMQALFEKSEESPGIKGLCIFKGKCVKFKQGKVPQIGWNMIASCNNNKINDDFVYFVNSYYAIPEDDKIISTTTDYYIRFASSLKYDNITAMQFHPEKSGGFGLELLRIWLKC